MAGQTKALEKDRSVVRSASKTTRASSPRQQPRSVWVVPLVLAALLIGLLGSLFRHGEPHLPAREPIVGELDVFDTFARCTLWTDRKRADEFLTWCGQDLRTLHNTINTYDPDSELSRLNRTAATTPFACSERLWDILKAAREAYRETEGAFDISVGPLMALWGFHRKRDTLPSDADIEAARATIGLDRVVFDDTAKTVHFTVPGMSLDLGGIAKGYALDRLMHAAERYGVDRALIDLGGNIGCTMLPPPGRKQFFIGIRDPFHPGGMLGRMGIVHRSVATSGNYERRIVIQGKTIGHIIDPRTGRPVTGPAGVTAITPRGVDSDVFSTAVFVRGKPLAEKLCRRHPRTGFVLISGEPDKPVRTVVGDIRVED